MSLGAIEEGGVELDNPIFILDKKRKVKQILGDIFLNFSLRYLFFWGGGEWGQFIFGGWWYPTSK